ncbi:asparagine synthase (glutamine-hydrolyzing) [Kaarinaea lacus]
MCGIGFIYDNQAKHNSVARIKRMVNTLVHRGPDEQNQLLRGRVALGHTRLSIVDVRGGSQPMLSKDGRYAIIYNGEIYNYRQLRKQLQQQQVKFRSQSDTEVILQLYIRDQHHCVDHLRGMFAFAIHDLENDSLFIARDRFGIKPLNYYWDGQTLIGASEIKAIFATDLVEPQFNYASLRNFFTFQCNLPPHTPFQHIYELPAGHTMTIAPDSKPEINQYWDLEFPRDGDYEELSEDQWLQKFDTSLNDAVNSHMIGEVPIGAYLSGGVDSATTTYLLKHYYPEQVQAFTIRFSNEANDEYPITETIANHIGVQLHDLHMHDDREQGFLDTLVDATYCVEQPQRMALDIPLYLLSQLVSQNRYKVVYTGEGADEIFGGYDCYRQDNIRIWGNTKNSQAERLEYYLSEFGNDFAADHLRLLARLHEPQRQQQTIAAYGCYPAWYDFWHLLDNSMDDLFSTDFSEQSANYSEQSSQLFQNIKPKLDELHPLNQSLYIEAKTRLPGWILWRGDRLAMAHGVEARVPFLDHPLVEMTAQLPPWLKLNGLDEKYILRKLMMPHLPEHPYYFKKRAFYTPIREWLFTKNKASALDAYLSESKLKEAGIFNPQTVKQRLQQLIAMDTPSNIDEYHRMMKLEWVLFLVLTIQILHELFIKRQARCFRP